MKSGNKPLVGNKEATEIVVVNKVIKKNLYC